MTVIDISNPVTVNPSSSLIRLTHGASDWLWAVFSVMALSTLIMIFWSHRRPAGQRVFHHLPILVLTTMTIAYYAMASNLGRTGVQTEFHRSGLRDIFWVRYIMWFICSPLLLLMLLLTTGISMSDIVLTVFMAWVWWICYLVGALTVTRFKWGFFAFGTAALLYVIWLKLAHTRRSFFHGGAATRTGYTHGAGYLSLVWLIYPIAWGICEGGNVIGIAGEMIFYGVLDLLAGPLFLFFVLHRYRNLDYNTLGLYSSKNTGYQGLDGAGVNGRGTTAGVGTGTGAAGTGTGYGSAGTGATGAAHAPGGNGMGTTGPTGTGTTGLTGEKPARTAV